MEWEPFIRLVAAAAYAGAIGLDRELRAKPAGLRTNIVVGVAAAAFGFVSVEGFERVQGYDPSRVASQVVSGIGFLGGGAIFAAGGKPHGLTTAAALWGSAAAGLAAGVGELTAGLALVVVTLVALWPLDWVADNLLRRRRRTDLTLHVVVPDLAAADGIRQLLRTTDAEVVQLEMEPLNGSVMLRMVVHGNRERIASAVTALRNRPEVLFLSEESQVLPGSD